MNTEIITTREPPRIAEEVDAVITLRNGERYRLSNLTQPLPRAKQDGPRIVRPSEAPCDETGDDQGLPRTMKTIFILLNLLHVVARNGDTETLRDDVGFVAEEIEDALITVNTEVVEALTHMNVSRVMLQRCKGDKNWRR